MIIMNYLSTYPSCPFTQIHVDVIILKPTRFTLSREKDKIFDCVDISCLICQFLQERTIDFKSAISNGHLN